MRINQPHLSIKVPESSQGIIFLEEQIQETETIINKLTEGQDRIRTYLKDQKIDDDVIAEKLFTLSKKIEQLSESVKDLKRAIDICTDDMSPLYQYFQEHSKELEESENDI